MFCHINEGDSEKKKHFGFNNFEVSLIAGDCDVSLMRKKVIISDKNYTEQAGNKYPNLRHLLILWLSILWKNEKKKAHFSSK